MDNRTLEREKQTLKYWQDNQIFQKSLKKKSPKGDYVFYDGPPFATGTPHYGHIVASLMKDAVPRFWTMNGYHVARRWGWDCHGLPVENLIEKELKIESKKQIEEEVSVCGFNEACKLSVMRYAQVWKDFIPKIGRWVDMDDDYKTMDPHYMESIWWVFKTLFDKGLIYEGYKSMHICPRCDTTLSNFEVTQGYKDIKDLSVIAKFELKDKPGTFVLAWTTTPWTLPGNVALAVGKDIDYVCLEIPVGFNPSEYDMDLEIEPGNYIFSEESAKNNNSDKLHKLHFLTYQDNINSKKFKGSDLIGKKYQPLFDYYLNADLANKENIYTIQAADFVSTEDGTGVVHIAPGFGQDDLNLGIEKKLPTILHVNPQGQFKAEVKDFAGLNVKPKDDVSAADKKVIEYLKDKKLLFAVEEYEHSYPHCWRCDTPLLNYATSSWFVKVTDIKKDLIKNNKKVSWTPAHLRDGRFGKWLENATDWAISRQRYWGAPLPVWKCDCGQIITVGSIKELEELSGNEVKDLHKHIVDEIKIKCDKCGQEAKRIPDVLDCWFESGSMPYAQVHYPFENKKWFEENFPAEFIAEGVDQTRGWFYTLMVLSTALFNKPAFENVIVNGIVLAEDGQKMSKRLKNYPEPDLIVDKYGADALRYYLLTSPVMEAETLNFSEEGVKEALQKLIMLSGNVLSFYKMYEQGNKIKVLDSKNILDKWILAKLNQLIFEVTQNMEKYDLVRSARPLQDFVNELSTWYLRRSRDRFKDGDEPGINTLGFVLREFAKVSAPFVPFLAEHLYQSVCDDFESVHLEQWPKANKKLIDEKLLAEMELTRQIVEKGLAARANAGIKIRQPLSFYATNLTKSLDKELVELIKDELNVKEIKFGKEEKLDLEITEELKQEGLVREVVRQINQKRKDLSLTVNDKVPVYQVGLDELFAKYGEQIKKLSGASEIINQEIPEMKDIEGGKIGIKIN